MIRFSDKVIEHFSNPRNVGVIENPDGMGTIDNPVCGDVTELYLRVRNGVIDEAKFKSLGCAVTIASASVFTEKIKGREISGFLQGSEEEIVRALLGLIEKELGDLPAQKLHCPPATVQAFFQALSQYYKKSGDEQTVSRLSGLIPRVAEYYKRGREDE